MASSIFTTTAMDAVGRVISLADCAGRVTVVVNTASLCSFAPRNMQMLAEAQQHYAHARPGATQILLFPTIDCGHQERMIPEEIVSWAGRDYGLDVHCLNERAGVTFASVGAGGGCPCFLFGRCHVKSLGTNWKAPPVWEMLSAAVGPPQWNWTKYIVGANGQTYARLPHLDCTFKQLKSHIDAALEM